MAIFTLLASFILTGTFVATGFGVSALALGLGLATTIGISYVMKSLAGTPVTPSTTDQFGTQGTLSAGGDVPRSFGLGHHMTAGSLVWANTWGSIAPGGNTTPNAYLTQVIALSDLPREQLLELWVNGEKVTIGGSSPPYGNVINEYVKASQPYLWVQYYDGTQTSADGLCVNYAASAERPYPSTRIGTGICYAVVTSLVNDTLFTGFPNFKFVLSGIPLYDPSKDSTNGGSGSHLWSNPATWGGDGDLLPAVQIYNVLRGIRYAGAWVYGLQNMTSAARLPSANWIAQIAKCRATVVGLGGPEPSYRAGGQINIDAQPANAVDALLTACQGRLSEIGGFYKIHLGAPDSSAFSWTDADLLSSEQQTYRPFFSLADSVNGIQGTYPDPLQGWETATAPPLYRTDLEVRDGNRRLMASPAFDFVPYPEQVQRLQKSGIEESQRARTHVLPLPPSYWVIEPGDVGSWTSVRNGYSSKLFRVDSVVDRANLDVTLNVTEVDPADYSWNHVTDYTGVSTGPTVFVRPTPQGVVDWFAEGWVLYDASAVGRRAAIRISWDGTLPGVVGIQYEVRLTIDGSAVTGGRTDQLAAGALIISQGIIPLTDYQVRGQYIPSSPRDMLWSDWLDVTTPDVVASDIPAWITDQVTDVMDYLNDRILMVEQRLATLSATDGTRNWLDLKEARSQMTSQTESAFAEISRVETVATDANTALASDIENLSVSVGDNSAAITINATAIATLDGFAASQYSVTLDVNNYATGFELINGGAGISSTTFITDKFIIAAPGVSGGTPVQIFAVQGTPPKVGIRGDLFVDGTIAGSRIIAGDITATQIAVNTIDASRILTNTITSASGKIGALSIQSLSLGGNSVTVPQVQSWAVNSVAGLQTLSAFTLSIDTAGLGGISIPVFAMAPANVDVYPANGTANFILLINGSTVQAIGGANHVTNACLGGMLNVTGTGGTVNVSIELQGAASGSFLSNMSGTLFAMAAKR